MEHKPWLKKYDKGVPHTLEPYPQIPLFGFVEQAARDYPNNTALIFKPRAMKGALDGLTGGKMDYRTFNELTDRMAGALAKLGVKKGDRVIILMPNSPQFRDCLLWHHESRWDCRRHQPALLCARDGIPVQRLRGGTGDRDEQFLRASQRGAAQNESQAGGRLAHPRVHGRVPQDAVPAQQAHRGRAQGRADAGATCGCKTCWRRARPPTVPSWTSARMTLPSSNTPAGQPAFPKGAMALHRNLVADTLAIKAWDPSVRQGKETVLVALPLFHVYGMVAAMNYGLAAAATLVLVPNPRDLENILSAINTYHPTLFPGVPTMYNAINNYPDLSRFNIRSIRACISGSAPLMPETQLKFEKLTGGKLREGYGLSEAPTASHCNPLYGENRVGSIGLPLPDVDCKIVSLDDPDKEVGVGEIGELCLKGPIVMQGYWNMPTETHNVLKDGWLYTGDIAKMDEDGYFYIVDRKKDMVIAGRIQHLSDQHRKSHQGTSQGVRRGSRRHPRPASRRDDQSLDRPQAGRDAHRNKR